MHVENQLVYTVTCNWTAKKDGLKQKGSGIFAVFDSLNGAEAYVASLTGRTPEWVHDEWDEIGESYVPFQDISIDGDVYSYGNFEIMEHVLIH